MADALIQVAERSDGLSRTAVKEELTWSLDAAGINPNATVVDRYADAILRATRSHLVIEADDGRVLGSWVGHAAGDNIRVQPGVSDAADGHRPFYS